MERGIFSMPLPPREKTPSQCFKEYSDWFSVLEDKGFGELWPGEHLTCLWENYPAGDLFLTALSRHTSTMKLGTGISILPLQHPGEVALRIAFLDQLSRRRIMFGVGPGGVPSDRPFMNVTVEHDKYFGRFVESLQMILHIWKYEAPYKLEGKYWTIALPANGRDITLANPMKPYQQPHPPAALPGNSPKSKSLRVGGKNGWLPITGSFCLPNEHFITGKPIAREQLRQIAFQILMIGQLPEKHSLWIQTKKPETMPVMDRWESPTNVTCLSFFCAAIVQMVISIY